jgi:hypothetical protein
MPDDTWLTRAQRCVSLLDPTDPPSMITIGILNKIQNADVDDTFISIDFYNVQQTAGGLPDTMTFQDFLDRVAGHIRVEIMKDLYGPNQSDDDVRQSLLGGGKWDANIQHHFRFLNGIVHQIAPGDVHVKLYNWILDHIGDDNSIYSCYRGLIVDDR